MKFYKRPSFWVTVALFVIVAVVVGVCGLSVDMRAWCATPLRQATMGDLLLLGIILAFVLNTYKWK